MDACLPWPTAPASSLMTAPAPTDSARHPDPDADDIVRAARGDQQAFARIVDRHLDRIHRLAWRSLDSRADAEEVAQETFLRAFGQLPDWTPGKARFSTWLYRVALNLCQDRLRRRREQVPVEDLDLADPGAAPDRTLEQDQRRQRVEQALRALPQRQREALLLCHFEGQSNAQAAQVLGVSVDALESLLARARRQLRAELAHD